MNGLHVLIIAAVSVGVLLVVILVPLSFTYIDRGSIGFKKNTASNEVDRSVVYPSGRYFWGLARAAVVFPSTLQIVALTGSHALSTFTDGGQTVQVEFMFRYRILPELLTTLYDSFGTSYHSRIVGIAMSELRTAAPQFRLQQYISDRVNVSNLFYQRLVTQLRAKAFVDVPAAYFLLLHITLPTAVTSQKITIFQVQQEQITATYQYQSDSIRLDTTKNVTILENNRTLIDQGSQQTATRLVAEASSRAFSLVQTERGVQLQNLITALGMTSSNSSITAKLILLCSMLDSPNSQSTTVLSGVSGTILQNT